MYCKARRAQNVSYERVEKHSKHMCVLQSQEGAKLLLNDGAKLFTLWWCVFFVFLWITPGEFDIFSFHPHRTDTRQYNRLWVLHGDPSNNCSCTTVLMRLQAAQRAKYKVHIWLRSRERGGGKRRSMYFANCEVIIIHSSKASRIWLRYCWRQSRHHSLRVN